MPHRVVAVSAQRQRRELLALIARIRIVAVGLSLVLAWLTQPVPVVETGLFVLTGFMAAYNLPFLLARRFPDHLVDRLAVASLAFDFIYCALAIVLTANDPVAANYVVFMVVAVEAAALFSWRGTIAFILAFVPAFGLVYFERSLFHFDNQIGSMVFRFGIVIVMAIMAGAVSRESEGRRTRAEAAAQDAIGESTRLAAVHRVAQTISSSLRREDVMNSTVDAVRGLFPGRWVGILLDDGMGVLRLGASRGEPSELEMPLPADPTLYSISETLVFEDFWNSPYLDNLGVVPPESLRAYHAAAVVPLHTGDRLLGSLVALGTNSDVFGPDDVRVLEAIGPQVSAALENARLYEETESLALIDPLTRLGNRRAFDQRLEEEIERAGRNGHPVSLALIDIDNFKVYNDTHGHPAGDDILRLLGAALRDRMVRRSDLAFRYGGEELAIVMPETGVAEAEAVMRRIHDAIALEPLPGGSHQPGGRLTISVGIAGCAGRCARQELLEQADMALFAAKQAGRNRTLVYESQMATTLTNWTRVLPSVLEDRALHSVYQPILRLDDSTVVGYEALARPDRLSAVISVEGMFAAAQRMGALSDLDWLSFRSAIQGAHALPMGTDLFVNITLSALLDATRDPEYLELVLRWAKRPTQDIVLEISEREAVSDIPRLVAILQGYRDLGFRFALDDVGEGHSTFELLAAAEPEFVKIAASLVRSSLRSGAAGTIQGLAAFARSTGARLIAEGIENEETASSMRSLGVELGQGYVLGEPADLPVVAGAWSTAAPVESAGDRMAPGGRERTPARGRRQAPASR
ncbi:MAG: diguanylate cyclase [Candidatus Dormiibacterota bacterium]